MSPRTSSIVQNIFSIWSFEISKGILRNQPIIKGLDSFSDQRLIYFGPIWIILVFASTTLAETAVWPIPFLIIYVHCS